MGRKSKYSKEVKIKACKDYENSNLSFRDIAKMVGTTKSVVRMWYLKYKEHGPDIFETSNKNRSYSKEFKLQVIGEYSTGNYSQPDLSAKYNISTGVISNWVNKCYNGIEIKDYNPKGDVYTMKSRKITFEERLEIVNWVIKNNMSYKNAADKYSINYAVVYKWTKTYIATGPQALEYKKRGPQAKTLVDESTLTKVQKLTLELEKEKTLRKKREFELEVLKKKEEFERQLQSRE